MGGEGGSIDLIHGVNPPGGAFPCKWGVNSISNGQVPAVPSMLQLWVGWKHRGQQSSPRDTLSRQVRTCRRAATSGELPGGEGKQQHEQRTSWPLQHSGGDLSLNPMQVTSKTAPRVPPAAHSAAGGTGSGGSGSWGGGCVLDRSQPEALSVSELLKNKCHPVTTLRRTNFPSRNCCSFNIFHQNHNAVLFSSRFYDVFSG